MSGLKTVSKEQALAGSAIVPSGGDYVWDGEDEDDRPLGKEEMRQGMGEKTGRAKKAISIRISDEVLSYFQSSGKGWQSRMNEVLEQYVETHR